MAKRYIDLSLQIHGGMATFPVHWHPAVEIVQLGRHGIENRESRRLVLGTHTGTHCEAPSHFIPGGTTVENIPLEQLIGPAELVDFSDLPDFYEISVADLSSKLAGKKPERLVLRFDWSQHFGTMKYYTDIPYLSEDAARWVVEQGIRLIAMDTPMPDNPKNGRGTPNDSPNHKTLLGNGVIIVEYLTNLHEVPVGEFELMVMPLRIVGADGSPVRCVAGVVE